TQRGDLFGRDKLHCDVNLLPGAYADFRAQVVLVNNFQRHIAEDTQAGVAAARQVRMRSAGEYPGLDVSVVKPCNDRDIKGHAARDSFDDPHELAPRSTAPSHAHGEEIDDARTVTA